jgi:hypothetical protein
LPLTFFVRENQRFTAAARSIPENSAADALVDRLADSAAT